MSIFNSIIVFGKILLNNASNLLNIGGIISGVIDWIKNVFRIDKAPSYNIEKSSIIDTKKINELLEKCIQDYNKETKEYDELAKSIINEQLSEIEKCLMKINRENKEEEILEDYIFDIFKNNVQHINKELYGIYSKQISNMFSLNNNKLLKILELNSGKEKKDKLNDLVINTVVDANNTLKNKLSTFIKEQEIFILNKLNEYMNNRKNKYIISKNETEKILNKSEFDKNFRLNKKKEYEEILDKLDLLNKILN